MPLTLGKPKETPRKTAPGDGNWTGRLHGGENIAWEQKSGRFLNGGTKRPGEKDTGKEKKKNKGSVSRHHVFVKKVAMDRIEKWKEGWLAQKGK